MEKGKVISALIGANGSGKTTLFDIISGFLEPDGGDIFFEGKSIVRMPPYKIAQLGISRTFQYTRIFPQLTALENVMLAGNYPLGKSFWYSIFRRRSVKKEEVEARERALKWLDFVGLEGKKNSLTGDLSYGQKKLVELSIALMADAPFLLLDEPLSGVYPGLVEKIMNLLISLKEDFGKTIFFIEHNLKATREISDWIIFIDEGKKIVEGRPEEVFKNEDVLKRYWGLK
ncbi:MAG: ABC transporter ATP-binding protein [Candidatus Eremiobacteraeota bacterium]|nr:ABC transporter ATP-binding protein [Candidatus Eremiobacteraeota bacterium]